MTIVAAWGVHVYTALGAVLGLAALLAAASGDAAGVFWWLAVALAIDSSDGTLARAARVKENVPKFDGARLDDVIDYLNYVLVPIFFMIESGLLVGPLGISVAFSALLASALRFCHADAKTPDHYFTGFPSYWNVVAFYLHVFAAGPVLSALITVILAAFVFAPLRFVYPSRTLALRPLTLGLGIVWCPIMIALIWALPERLTGLAAISLYYPLYYTLVSFYLQWRSSHRSPQPT